MVGSVWFHQVVKRGVVDTRAMMGHEPPGRTTKTKDLETAKSINVEIDNELIIVNVPMYPMLSA